MKFKTGRKYDVVGVVHALVDILAYVDQNLLDKYKLSKGTMKLVDKEEAEFLSENIRYIKIVSGGSASNTISGIASFGGRAAIIGKVKDDEYGAIFKRDIGTCGVDFKGVTAAHGNPTGRCIVAVSKEDADRTMRTYLGAAVDMLISDIDSSVIKDSSAIYIEGYLLDREGSREAMRVAMNIAHEHNHIVSFTLSDARCVKQHKEVIFTLLKEVDLLFANEQEIKTLFETSDLNEALNKIKNYCKITTVTMGKKGSVVVTKDEMIHVHAAANPIKIIDTTGAGDLYASGFLYGLIKGMTLKDCARLGNMAAAEVISHIGARPEISLSSLLKNL